MVLVHINIARKASDSSTQVKATEGELDLSEYISTLQTPLEVQNSGYKTEEAVFTQLQEWNNHLKRFERGRRLHGTRAGGRCRASATQKAVRCAPVRKIGVSWRCSDFEKLLRPSTALAACLAEA